MPLFGKYPRPTAVPVGERHPLFGHPVTQALKTVGDERCCDVPARSIFGLI
jgi:hypothetical protein